MFVRSVIGLGLLCGALLVIGCSESKPPAAPIQVEGGAAKTDGKLPPPPKNSPADRIRRAKD